MSNKRLTIGITVDQESLEPFLSERLREIQKNCEGIVFNLASYSRDPQELDKIASKLETLRFQIEDVSHIRKQYEEYKIELEQEIDND